jgi:hypothetical protein
MAREAWVAAVVAWGCLLAGQPAAAADTQTIVMLRHGEKPAGGLGQLTCQGLNRALALPAVLVKAFGGAMAVFAPDPAVQKEDEGKLYDYVRPLATIEPTAIALGLPVHTKYGVTDIAGLRKALETPAYRKGVVFVAWEHREIEHLARMLMSAHGADQTSVPKWAYDDFDSIYVVRLTWTGAAAAASFAVQKQGLDGQPTTCPK